MNCDCTIGDFSTSLEGPEAHDHLNCACCHPKLEEGERIEICPDCGKKMLVNSAEEIFRHYCGRSFFQDTATKTLTMLKRIGRITIGGHKY
jgi:predicted amidophosphoribosyltransferase